MAWTEKNGKSWRAAWKDTDGKTKKGPSFATAEEAMEWVRVNHPTVELKLLSEAIDLWRQNDPSMHRTVAAERVGLLATQRKWTQLLEVTPLSIARWQQETKNIGVSRTLQYLLTILRWSQRIHGARVNPDVLTMAPPKSARHIKPTLLSDAQVDRIRACSWDLGQRAGAIIDYLLSYGARPITACRLRKRDLDPGRCELTIPNAKHSGGWRHPITEAQAALWLSATYDHLSGDDPLFPHYKEDRPWKLINGSAAELKSWWQGTIVKRLKLPKPNGIYQLKRWSITKMLSSGLDPATVALFTGHLDLDQVLTYNTTSDERARQVLGSLKTLGGDKNHLTT